MKIIAWIVVIAILLCGQLHHTTPLITFFQQHSPMGNGLEKSSWHPFKSYSSVLFETMFANELWE